MEIYNINQINFTSRLSGKEYQEYLFNKHLNGKSPDYFILSQLVETTHEPEKSLVFDFGAGQGRNTIPIAQLGYDVYAFDVNKIGLNDIKRKSNKNGLKDKIKLFRNNILDNFEINGEKANFAFMSHISQHFSPRELEIALQNITSKLNDNGVFIMDALIRQNKYYKKYDDLPLIIKLMSGKNYPDTYGSASFEHEEILKAAQKAGIRLTKETPFEEKSPFRTSYERQNLWGGSKISDYLLGIERRPVKLTWFVFKK